MLRHENICWPKNGIKPNKKQRRKKRKLKRTKSINIAVNELLTFQGEKLKQVPLMVKKVKIARKDAEVTLKATNLLAAAISEKKKEEKKVQFSNELQTFMNDSIKHEHQVHDVTTLGVKKLSNYNALATLSDIVCTFTHDEHDEKQHNMIRTASVEYGARNLLLMKTKELLYPSESNNSKKKTQYLTPVLPTLFNINKQFVSL